MDELFPDLPIPLEAQIDCAVREIYFRERVYPRWVEEGRMSRKKADGELAAMKAILDTLRALRDQKEHGR